MEAMEESGSLARSFHLPPVEIASDRSSFKNLEPKNWPRNLLSTINKIIVRLDCVEPELTLQNKCEEHIVSLLILCGENFIAAEWNNAQVVHQADKAFHSLARVLDIQTPAEIFKLERIALLLFNELKIKINKDDMKRYPASAYCFTWAVNFLSVTQLEVLVPHILPVCLVLLDDWEIENQVKGFDSIHHILKENPKSLVTFGWHGVIYASLKKSTQLKDKLSVYECLDICLQNQLPSRLFSTEWNKNNEYDSLVGTAIQMMIVEDSPQALISNLKILHMLVNSMQVKIASHLHPILTAIESKVMENTPEEAISVICHLIDGIMQYCWPCFEESLCSLLAWLIYKLTIHPEGSVKTVLQTKKSFETILRKVSPNLAAALHGVIES